MATLALDYRVHGDGAGRDEEERSGERNSYRGAVEWMKVEVSWGRLLRVHFKTWCGRYDVSVKPTELWVGLLHSGSVLLSFRRANGGFEMYSKGALSWRVVSPATRGILQFLRPFRGSADAPHNCRLSQGSLADRLFLQFSRRWQVAVATIKGEGR